MGKMLRANDRRQKMFVHDLPAPPVRLPANDVLVIWIAYNRVQLCWEVWLQPRLLLVVAAGSRWSLVVRRHLHLGIISIRVVDDRLLNLRLLPLSGWVVIIFHRSTMAMHRPTPIKERNPPSYSFNLENRFN